MLDTVANGAEHADLVNACSMNPTLSSKQKCYDEVSVARNKHRPSNEGITLILRVALFHTIPAAHPTISYAWPFARPTP
jgi:hypothetical protein